MSILFGVANFDGRPLDISALHLLASRTSPWAEDGCAWDVKGPVALALQPYHTFARSQMHWRPDGNDRGDMITLDGRLDNREELARLLNLPLGSTSDAAIMLSSFERWGSSCFSRFVGDWAIVLWSASERSLYLARDHAGTRKLYYRVSGQQLVWGTYLETFVGGDADFPPLNEEFATIYLLGRRLANAAPFSGIRAVPAAHWMEFTAFTARCEAFWTPLRRSILHYPDEREYEMQFLELFEQAVARRTCVGEPALAHLSGGMDSSSIVCISDQLRRQQCGQEAPLLDTLSFYNDSEPSWNEKPFFTEVERLRNKQGIHLDVSEKRSTLDPAESVRVLLPGYDSGAFAHEERLEAALAHGKYRVVLSGLGGDEFFGGVPTPLPELADHLVKLHLATFLRRSVAWALHLRQPLYRTLLDAGTFAYQTLTKGDLSISPVPPWITPRTLGLITEGEFHHTPFAGALAYAPSRLVSEQALHRVLETLPQPEMSLMCRREHRFPFLDRDLLEFALCLPSEQLVQPGRRRYLMRRALKGIVPDLVLERRRKAFLERSPLLTLQLLADRMRALMRAPLLAQLSLIEPREFLRCLDEELTGATPRWRGALLRTCQLELWLQSGIAGLPHLQIGLPEGPKFRLALPDGKSATEEHHHALRQTSNRIHAHGKQGGHGLREVNSG